MLFNFLNQRNDKFLSWSVFFCQLVLFKIGSDGNGGMEVVYFCSEFSHALSLLDDAFETLSLSFAIAFPEFQLYKKLSINW